VKRRVAFVSVVPSPYQRDLFAALAQRPEIDLSVYYLERSAPDSPWPEKALTPYESILPGFWFPLRGARVHVNWRLPRPESYDILVVNTLMSITGQRLMRFLPPGKPWIFMGERLNAGGRAWHDYLTAPLHDANAIAAIGTWAERDYAHRFPEPKTFNLPYCCNLEPYFNQARHPQGDEIVFLFCGQMIRRKGVDLLLNAFARLGHGRLLLVGREAELPSLLREFPTETRSRIEYINFQSPDALPTIFARADVFVLPSRYDGWGVVVNQAIAAGLPVICSDQVGAGYDLVEDGINGIKFPAANEDALAEALQFFAEHPNSILPWGAISQAKARTLTPASMSERWVSAIDQVLAA